MVIPFFVEAGLLLQLRMYSRKIGLRLQRKFGNLLKTRLCRGFRCGRPRITWMSRIGSDRRGLGLYGTRMRPKFY